MAKRKSTKEQDWSATADKWGTPEHEAWRAKNDPRGRRFRKFSEIEVISDEHHAYLMRKFRGGK